MFDYFDSHKAAARMQWMQAIVKQAGEPMKSSFDPLGLAGKLRSLGLELRQNLAPAEIQARYFANRRDRYRAFEHLHLALVEVVSFIDVRVGANAYPDIKIRMAKTILW